MIVISDINSFNSVKQNFTNEFSDKGIDLIPIALNNGSYFLNESVLKDENFASFFETFIDYTIREISQNEFINPVLKIRNYD